MPAAEPGNVQRPRRHSLRGRQAHVPQADQPVRRRCCWTASAACCARAAPGSPTRSPATRSSSCWNAARCSRSASPPTSRSTRTSPATPCRSARSGALTGPAYRFRARPFDLVSSPSVCEHCASGCAQRTDHRRGMVLRRLAGDDPEVNEEWNCDKGRWAFKYATQRRPHHHPAGPRRRRQAARRRRGRRRIAVAAAGLRRPRRARRRRAGRRPGHRRGRLRLRQVRANGAGHQRHRLPRPPHSREEADFLAGPDRRAADDGHLRRPGSRAGGAAGRVRARGGIARSSSCGCARRPASTDCRSSRSRRSPPAG